MNLYAFELGRKKDLCFEELLTVLGEKNLLERNLDTAIFEIDDLNAEKLQNNLGGTIKIIEIFAGTDFQKNTYETLEKIIESHLSSVFKGRSGKIPFSISLLSFFNQRDINIKKLLNFSKKILKSLGLNSRFVNKNFQNTKPSTIFKARVIEKGIDINIIKGLKKIFIGETITIQNIDKYSKRDFNKPWRDAKIGMMPPKLAQIMINLANSPSDSHKDSSEDYSKAESKINKTTPLVQTIYDPFCGTGTILMEGLLMGKNVIGSDIDPRMVEYTKKNLEWFEREFEKSLNKRNSHRVFERDARFLNKECLPEKIDAVVTESYLGGPQTVTPPAEDREKIFRELANLHLNWLKAINPLLGKGARIVMCALAFRTKTGIEYFPKFKELAKIAGFKVLGNYLYDREDQVVLRDIKVLEKIY